MSLSFAFLNSTTKCSLETPNWLNVGGYDNKIEVHCCCFLYSCAFTTHCHIMFYIRFRDTIKFVFRISVLYSPNVTSLEKLFIISYLHWSLFIWRMSLSSNLLIFPFLFPFEQNIHCIFAQFFCYIFRLSLIYWSNVWSIFHW